MAPARSQKRERPAGRGRGGRKLLDRRSPDRHAVNKAAPNFREPVKRLLAVYAPLRSGAGERIGECAVGHEDDVGETAVRVAEVTRERLQFLGPGQPEHLPEIAPQVVLDLDGDVVSGVPQFEQ